MKILCFCLFLVSYCFAEGFSSEESERRGLQDSVEIYQTLIADEIYYSGYGAYKEDFDDMIAGAIFTGIGVTLLTPSVLCLATVDDRAIRVSVGALLVSSIPFLVIGIPKFTYNLVYYNIHKSHERKAFEYEKALERYKKNKLRLSIIPTINPIDKQTGMNLVLAF